MELWASIKKNKPLINIIGAGNFKQYIYASTTADRWVFNFLDVSSTLCFTSSSDGMTIAKPASTNVKEAAIEALNCQCECFSILPKIPKGARQFTSVYA